MDIGSYKNIFFLRENMVKHNGFDSHSKNPQDVITHYKLKYDEIEESMKAYPQYTSRKWKYMCEQKVLDASKLQLPPFEAFITAFILSFQGRYKEAIKMHHQCQSLLPDTLDGKINAVFINLQIAQLFERMGNDGQALSLLIKTRATIQRDKSLFAAVHNFYASCCVSIGLLCFRYKKLPSIALSSFITSLLTRIKYKETYSYDVYEHYIAQASRYVGMMPVQSCQDAYAFIRSAYNIRLGLLQRFSDDVTKEEMFQLERDFLIFLIINRYKKDLVIRHSRVLLRLIVDFSPELRRHLSHHIFNIAQTLHRYYQVYMITAKADLWKHIMNHINSSYEYTGTHCKSDYSE